MLKLTQFLTKNHSLILVILFSPLIGVFLGNKFKLEMIPSSPHQEFIISFDGPSMSAEEMKKKVTLPVEKVLNGLPGLIRQSSSTTHESSRIDLIFEEQITKNNIYLNIQEKMDRIRLLLPKGVTNYRVQPKENPVPPDITIHFNKKKSFSHIKKHLEPFNNYISKTVPALDQKIKIEILPHPKKLFQNQISISQLHGALKSIGLTTTLGRRKGLLYETGLNFTKLSEIQSSLISSRGDRPLRVSDVADVRISYPEGMEKIQFWIDKEKMSTYQFSASLSETFKDIQNKSYTKWTALIQQSLQPLLLLIIILILQSIWLLKLHLPIQSLFFFITFEGLLFIHFIFWKGLFNPPLTVLDLNAMILIQLTAFLFLLTLSIRIRSHLFDNPEIDRPPKSLEQAKLFSLVELIPTFATLGIALWIISLPVLSTGINFQSRYILSSFLYFGYPIMLSLLMIIPLSLSGEFFKSHLEYKENLKNQWMPTPQIANLSFWSLGLLTLILFLLFKNFNYSLYPLKKVNSSTLSQMQNLRGYHNRLAFKEDQKVKSQNYIKLKKNSREPARIYEFSKSGLRFLNHLDVSGFAGSLKDIQNHSQIGSLTHVFSNIPINYKPIHFSSNDVGELLLASKSNSTELFPLRVLTEKTITTISKNIYRDNMDTSDEVVSRTENRLFSNPDSAALSPNAWSAFILKQYNKFKKFHFISLIFLFFLFAIYLNSFTRSLLVLIFTMASSSLLILTEWLLPSYFHIDSLWLFYQGIFLALFIVLVLTRVVDIERSRGYDRDLCLKEVQALLVPGIYKSTWVYIFILIAAGIFERIPQIPTLGLWYEAFFIGGVAALLIPLSRFILFPLFYLTSEESLNKLGFRFYRIWNVFKLKKLGK